MDLCHTGSRGGGRNRRKQVGFSAERKGGPKKGGLLLFSWDREGTWIEHSPGVGRQKENYEKETKHLRFSLCSRKKSGGKKQGF